MKVNECRSITKALFIGLFFVRQLKGGEKLMRYVVDRENPRELHVMGDRLEDLVAGVYQHTVSIPLYSTNRKVFL